METNIHYPTDVSLFHDAGRKCLDTIGHILKHLSLKGWRKWKAWKRRLRNQARYVSQVAAQGGANKQFRLAYAVDAYVHLGEVLAKKIQQSLPQLQTCGLPAIMPLETQLKQYHTYLQTFSDQILRRLIHGEVIPHAEKVFSIFEPHTEWINKGKRHPKFELGHPILVATDQFHFILTHQVVEKQADVELAIPLVKTLKEKYQRKIYSMSFDRGFYSKPNKEALTKEVQHLCLPKKGKKKCPRRTRRSP